MSSRYFSNRQINYLEKGSILIENGIPVIESPVISLNGVQDGNHRYLDFNMDILHRGLLFTGGTGYGKTFLITEIVQRLRELNEPYSMVIIDTKGDYVSKLYRTGDVIIGADTYSSLYPDSYNIWNLFCDITYDGWQDDVIAPISMEVVKKLFEDKENQSQKFFVDAAIVLLHAVIMKYIRDGRESLNKRAKMSNKGLLDFFLSYKEEDYLSLVNETKEAGILRMVLGNSRNNQALGVLGQTVIQMITTFIGAFGGIGNFSIREFANEKNDKCLFVEVDPMYLESQSRIYGLLINLLFSQLESRNNSNGNIIVIMDELPLLGRIKLPEALNFGRGKGLVALAGFQTISQLYDIYGEYKAENLIAGLSSKFFFHSNDNLTSKYIAESFGKNKGTNVRISAGGCYVNERKENVICESDLYSLGEGDFICSLLNSVPFRFKVLGG